MRTVIKRIISPIAYFIRDSRAAGIVLIACTVLSIIVANAGFGSAYIQFWENPIHAGEALNLPHNLTHWINNFLMGIFFVMMGTEIKRELIDGELSVFKKALLPFGAAIGGMLLPALIYYLLNAHSDYAKGWGIPTATDIAFALGVATLLGNKVPLVLKVLLMVLAIIDDLGAIIVIAFFYGGQINWIFFGISAVIYAVLLLLLYFKVKFGALQIVLGLLLWYTIFNTGIEGSIAGVLFAFAIPTIKLVSVEKYIHNFVSFFVLPVFALANTAIQIPDNFFGVLGTNVSLGVILGLVIGKPLGVYLASRMMVYFKWAKLPDNVNWNQIFGMGMLAGIGFTMSIFITMLAFDDDSTRNASKIAILTAVSITVLISVIYFQLIHTASKKHLKNSLHKT